MPVDNRDTICKDIDMTNYEKVREFHKKFQRPLDVCVKGDKFSAEQTAFRIRLVEEEFTELKNAIENDDHLNILEELTDVLYAVYGMAAEYGFDIDKAFDRTHESNMSKTMTPGTGKLAKGPDFKPKNLSDLI